MNGNSWIVDDQPDNLAPLENLLETEGYCVLLERASIERCSLRPRSALRQ